MLGRRLWCAGAVFLLVDGSVTILVLLFVQTRRRTVTLRTTTTVPTRVTRTMGRAMR